MRIQKILKYKPVNLKGELLDITNELTLSVNNKLGNYLIYKSILRHFILKRQGTLSTKTRAEVKGGGRKPWKQKGTGRARAGSNRSPLWKGGGVIFGPKLRTKNSKLNKKERRLALQTLFYNKKNNILVIDNLEENFIEPKTKAFCTLCSNCNINLNQKILLIVSKKIETLKFAVQNIPTVELITASSLNSLSLIKAKHLIVTTLAINELQEVFDD